MWERALSKGTPKFIQNKMAEKNYSLGSAARRARRRRLFLVRFTIITLGFLVALIGLALFSGWQKIVIHEVKIVGQAALAETEIKDIVERDLGGRYLYLFSRRNFLIFPRLMIKRDLLAELPILQTVDVSWNGWGKILITVVEKRPEAVWCGAKPETGEQCFFLDKTGLVYDLAPDFSGGMYLRYYAPILAGSPLRARPLTEGIFQYFNRLIKILFDEGIVVEQIYFDGRDYTFILTDGLKIIFNDREGLSQPFNNLLIALRAGELDLSEAQRKKIAYLDLRFDNKVIVGKNGSYGKDK